MAHDLTEQIEIDRPMTIADVKAQVNLIQQLMKDVMQKDEHFGVIPGCGDKPALLKPGAEKLCLTFGFAPDAEIDVIDRPNGHHEYRCKVQLYWRSGKRAGSGIGTCSTLESKYRYRWDNTGRDVPKDYWDHRDRDLLGGDAYVARKVNNRWMIFQRVDHDNPADYYNCVTPDTKILTHDLRWVPAGKLVTGDQLISVDEQMTSQYARSLSVGSAIVHGHKHDVIYRLTLDDGRQVRCNGEHQWLVKKIGLKGTEWIRTDTIYKEIAERRGRPRHWSIMTLCRPWDEDVSRDGGYIAGLLDADGSLATKYVTVVFAQQPNVAMRRIERLLADRGFTYGRSSCRTSKQIDRSASKTPVYNLCLTGGFAEQLRLLGSIRPPRLLDRWLQQVNLSSRRLEGRGSGAGRPVRIMKIERIGSGEIILLGSTTYTYIAEGLVAHNTCEKMAKKRALVDAILTATAASDIFTQDVEEFDQPTNNQDKAKAADKKAETPPTAPQKQEDEVQLRAALTTLLEQLTAYTSENEATLIRRFSEYWRNKGKADQKYFVAASVDDLFVKRNSKGLFAWAQLTVDKMDTALNELIEQARHEGAAAAEQGATEQTAMELNQQ